MFGMELMRGREEKLKTYYTVPAMIFLLCFKDQTVLVISPVFASVKNGKKLHEFQKEAQNTFINILTRIIPQRAYKQILKT